MTEQQLRDLIGCVVVEVLGHTQPTPTPTVPRPAALVLFSGALLGFEAACDSLTRLRDSLTLEWVSTPSAQRILDQTRIEAIGMARATESFTHTHDVLIVPTLTVNLAAKVAHGIGDCLASNVMAEFIMHAKPVVAATNAACPDHADKRGWFPDLPSGYATMLRGNLEALRSFGVCLTTAERLDAATRMALTDATAMCPERVITEEVVGSFAPGSTVQLLPTAIVTDLAREAAASNGIILEKRS